MVFHPVLLVISHLFQMRCGFHQSFLLLLQALGDLVESIAGAILIDTKLNLNEVWRIFKPLLSPIVTPDKLELPPLRELNELCDSLGYFIKEKCTNKGELVHAELRLQMIDVLLVGEGCGRNKKAAKGQAAAQLLKNLEVCWCFPLMPAFYCFVYLFRKVRSMNNLRLRS